MQDMTFRWKGDDPVSFPSDFGDGYRLPKYVVSFTIDHELHNIYYGEGYYYEIISNYIYTFIITNFFMSKTQAITQLLDY